MKPGEKVLIFVVSGSLLLPSYGAAVARPDELPPGGKASANYDSIVARNVFALKPPPQAPDPELNKPPPPKITPTGITTILGNKRALFKVQMPARPPEPAKEQAFILTEGQREGQIEVLEIDEKAGSIKFNNFGTIVTLTLDKDGAKLPNTPAPAVPPPGVPATAGYVPAPAGGSQPGGGSAITTIGGAGAGLKSIPTRTLRLPSTAAGQTQATGPAPALSHEEQIILMELEREQHKNDPKYPPPPPTPITPGGSEAVKIPQPPPAPQ
jgi:hypothetical protein